MFTPAFRTALLSAGAGAFLFVAGVSLTASPYRVAGLAGAATGALLLATAFPRLWQALPGLPTGRIAPPLTAPAPATAYSTAAAPVVDLFADLPACTDLQPPPGVDPRTGEVLTDPYTELERRLTALGDVVAEQSDLFAQAFAELRTELRTTSATQAPSGPRP